MAALNQYYDNFVLQNEIENMYNTQLNMAQFCTPDTSLVGVAGDIVKVNVYSATSAAEEVDLGVGNTGAITTTLQTKQYKVLLGSTKRKDAIHMFRLSVHRNLAQTL